MNNLESREIYRIAKMNMTLGTVLSNDNGRISHVFYEYSSEFNVEFAIVLLCNVLSVARYRAEEGYVRTSSNLDVYELIVMYSGQAEYRCGDTVYTAGAGDALFINSALPCEIRQLGTAPMEFVVINLSGLSAMNYYTLLSKNRTEPIHIGSQERIDGYIDKIVYYMKYPTNLNNVLMVDTMSGLFTELYLNAAGSDNRDSYYRQPQWFIDTIRYIESHAMANITIGGIAESLGMSESYFHKLFREYTGTTPYQYLLNLRINAAQSLLVSTDHQIKYIAYTVGFNSVSHFITHFKKATGYTPTEYREQKQKTIR